MIRWTSFHNNSNRINSLSEYDGKSNHPVRTFYYENDGVSVKDIHEYFPNGVNLIKKQKNPKNNSCLKSNYASVPELDNLTKERMAKLIDNLFGNKAVKFECI